MQLRCLLRQLWSFVFVAFPVAAAFAELPQVSVELATGRKLRAVVDARTNDDQLWLRFGSGDTFTRRGFKWELIGQINEGDRTLGKSELITRAASEREQISTRPQRQLVVRTSVSPSDLPARVEPRTSSHASRIVSVTFDVTLANWDADVMTDGLELHVTAWNAHGEPVPVRGTVTAELFSMKRVEQDEIRHGRGRDLRRMERWSNQIDLHPDSPNEGIVRLPFQTPHPEFDVDWAPFGLVHVQLVAPGHGVFHHSIDGLRIRPWAPLRDLLELQTGRRYFPSELQ